MNHPYSDDLRSQMQHDHLEFLMHHQLIMHERWSSLYNDPECIRSQSVIFNFINKKI